MKLKHIIPTFLVLLAVLTGCDEFKPSYLDDIKVSSSYIALPDTGGDAEIKVTAIDSWKISSAIPSWLTISDTIGNAGETTVRFNAKKTLDGRSADLTISCAGATQHIKVIQGVSAVANVTCAEIFAKKDDNGKTYRVTGVVNSIVESATYGNFYIEDGTSDTLLYIYGTKYQGNTKQGALLKLGIEVGDEVVVEGPKDTYNGVVELKDVDVIEVRKSLIKIKCLTVGNDTINKLGIEGGDIVAHLSCKGDGVYADIPADAKDWLSIAAVTGGANPTVVFHATPNEGGERSTAITIKTTKDGKEYTSTATIIQTGSIKEVTCAQFNALEDGTAQYKVSGIITKIASTERGNLYINDGTGEVYVYGITDWKTADLKVGDQVTLQSVKTSYKGAAQMKDAIVVEKIAHEVKTAAELQELPDNKTTYYLVTGEVFHMEGDNIKFDLQTYGNFGLRDATGEIYVYGVADGLNGVTKNFAATGIKEGDTITILAYKTSYKGLNQIVGKFIKKEAE